MASKMLNFMASIFLKHTSLEIICHYFIFQLHSIVKNYFLRSKNSSKLYDIKVVLATIPDMKAFLDSLVNVD